MDDLMPGASAAEESLLAGIAGGDIQAAALFPLQNPNPVLRAAPDGTVLFANRASQSLLNSWGAGAGGRLPDEMQRLIQETLASGKQHRIRLPHADEVLELDFIPIKDGGHANIYARDVTAQVKAEAALREERDLLQATMEHSRASLVYLDPDFNLVAMNSAYEVACQRSRVEMLGRNHFDLFPNAENEAIFRRVRDTGETIEYSARPFEFVDQPWRGVTYWDWTLAPVKDGSGVKGLILSLVDVTERVREGRLRGALNTCYALFNSMRDVRGLVEAVLAHGAEVLYCQSAHVLLARDNQWVIEAAYGRSAHLAGTAYPAEQVPMAAWVAQMREPLLAEDLAADGRFASDLWAQMAVRSCLAAPLLHHAGHAGALVFNYHEHTMRFGKAELEFAERLAALVSLAYEKARLAEAERQAIDALQQANEQLARRVKERTAELEAIFASLPDAVYVGNENGMYLVNQAALDNLGCDGIEDLQGRIPDLAEKVRTRHAASGQRLAPEEEPFARALQGEKITLEMILRNLKTGQDSVVRSACAPIVHDGKVIGAVAVNTDITERLRADAELRAHREQLKNLSRRLIELQESERQFIARQLYDDEGQRLAALLVQLRMLELDPECGPAVLARIADLKNLAAGLLQDLHSLAVDLRPASLDQLGLPHALRQYAQDFGQAHNLQVQSEFIRMDTEHLARDTETAIYRIMQEALENIVRHAQANRVDIVVQKRADSVAAIIEDNGVGFDVDEAVREGSLGLVGMRERAESVGGSLTIESVRGRGTAVYVEVPC